MIISSITSRGKKMEKDYWKICLLEQPLSGDYKTVDFVRHGTTDLNKKNVFLGRLDVGIDRKYIDPAVIDRLKKIVRGAEIIYSSPAKRCIETSDLINEGVNKPIITNYNLWEIDYGELDGKPFDYLNKYPDLQKAWVKKEDPRFPNGENYADVRLRIDNFLDSMLEKYVDSVAVSHNVVLRMILGESLRIPQHLWFKIPVKNFESFEFKYTKDRRLYSNMNESQTEKIKGAVKP